MINKGELIDNRYKIIGSIGEGGMANVYLAWDTILEREVAVKILRGDLSHDEKFIKRFQREANAASSLRHPNIVEMYDVGEDEGKYFIVMEYVKGKTLKSLIKKRGALNLTEAIDIMLQITSGIACAHDSYIIHRDIKPQNILILEDGRVKITDFGIAMALKNNELTQTDSVMGSVHYLPPEQANGNGSTTKSDIYSTGILFYELLTGKVPFKGENAVEIALKHMKEPIPSVRKFNEEIPQSVENIILRACAKNPKNRYSSVAEMYEDIKTCLSEDRMDEKRLVYKYPENNLEETKTITNLEKREIRNKLNETEEVENTDKKTNKALKITGIICIAIVVLALIFIFVITSFKNKEIKVPEKLLGATEKKACQKIEKAGLICKVEYDYDEEKDEDQVLKVKPKSGSKLKKGATVTIIVSSFDGTVLVENYVGKNIKTIQQKLEKKGIIVSTLEKSVTKKDNIAANTIVEQSVKKGERLEKGDTIELTYAVLVEAYPDFTDGSYTKVKVQQFCEDNKITCNFTDQETKTYETGTILSQSRAAGDEIKEGQSITITVAKKIEEPKVEPKQAEKQNTQTDTTKTDNKEEDKEA